MHTAATLCSPAEAHQVLLQSRGRQPVHPSCCAVVLLIRLEMVIAESGGKDGPHLDADEENPEGVYFTMHK